MWLNLEKSGQFIVLLVGPNKYSEKTLCVLMRRLQGLFNSANRHKKKKKSVSATLLRLAFTLVWKEDEGGIPSADLCELTIPLS